MQEDKIYKYRLKLIKNNELKFISHLDWQNLILKIFRRCNLELVLSEGFNKMPKVSYSPALPIFLESECEMVNFQVKSPLNSDFKDDFQKMSPNGLEVVDIIEIDEKMQKNEPKSLENYIQWAEYKAMVLNSDNTIYNLDEISYSIEKCLSSDEFLISKKTKKGIEKTINYRNSIKSLNLKEDGSLVFILKAGQDENIPSLRADEFLRVLFNEKALYKIKRVRFFDSELRVI